MAYYWPFVWESIGYGWILPKGSIMSKTFPFHTTFTNVIHKRVHVQYGFDIIKPKTIISLSSPNILISTASLSFRMDWVDESVILAILAQNMIKIYDNFSIHLRGGIHLLLLWNIPVSNTCPLYCWLNRSSYSLHLKGHSCVDDAPWQYWRSCTPSRSIGECAVPDLNAILCFLWFTNCVLLFDNNLILGCLWHCVFV